jgi:hypothetical protein
LRNLPRYCLVIYPQKTGEPEATTLNLEKIVADLKSEMDRIGRAIGLLEASESPKARRGRPRTISAAPSRKPHRKGLTAAGRKRLSELMKKRWAERKKRQS